MKTQYYTYIATNYTHTVLYTGISNNPIRRSAEHISGIDSSSFTCRYNIFKIIWIENFNTAIEAIMAEKKIKGWKREKKIKLINETNPTGKTFWRTRQTLRFAQSDYVSSHSEPEGEESIKIQRKILHAI